MFLPKMSAYRGNFQETNYMSFFKEDGELVEKYNEIWEKVKNSIKNEFDSEPVYNEKYLIKQIFTIIKYQKKVFSLFVYQ